MHCIKEISILPLRQLITHEIERVVAIGPADRRVKGQIISAVTGGYSRAGNGSLRIIAVVVI